MFLHALTSIVIDLHHFKRGQYQNSFQDFCKNHIIADNTCNEVVPADSWIQYNSTAVPTSPTLQYSVAQYTSTVCHLKISQAGPQPHLSIHN